MKKILTSLFEPLYYLYQGKFADKIISFFKKFPVLVYLLAAVITVGILYLVLVGL